MNDYYKLNVNKIKMVSKIGINIILTLKLYKVLSAFYLLDIFIKISFNKIFYFFINLNQ